MTASTAHLMTALDDAAATRPAVDGFPHFAETLRGAGIRRIEFTLPSMQSLYLTDLGPVMVSGEPIVDGPVEVPAFDDAALRTALRDDRAGKLAFPQFALAAWHAGVVGWIVDLDARVCTYRGAAGERFDESYSGVSLPAATGAHR